MKKAGNTETITEYLKMRRREGTLGTCRTGKVQVWELLDKLKAALEEIPDLAYVSDDLGNLLYMNRAFEEIAGNRVEDFLGRPFHPLFDEANLAVAAGCFEKTMAGERTTCELQFKDTGILCEFKSVPLKDASGKVTGAIGIARQLRRSRQEEIQLEKDRRVLACLLQERTEELIKTNEELLAEISRREAAEGAAGAFELKFRALLETIPDAVIVAEAQNGTVTHANRAASLFTGIPAEEMTGINLSVLGLGSHFHSAGGRRARKTFIRNVSTRRASRVCVSSVEADAGGHKAVYLVLRPLEGRSAGASGKRPAMPAEPKGPTALLADINGVIEFTEPVFNNLTGFSAAETAGTKLRSYFGGAGQYDFDDLFLTVCEGRPWSGELNVFGKNNASTRQKMLVTPLKAEDGSITHMLFTLDRPRAFSPAGRNPLPLNPRMAPVEGAPGVK